MLILQLALYWGGFALIASWALREKRRGLAVGFINAGIGIVQELFAKRRLDKIALLARAKATVLRDGQERQVDPDELVVGDILVVRRGDQVMLDGHVLGAGKMAVDESLLTGETDLV